MKVNVIGILGATLLCLSLNSSAALRGIWVWTSSALISSTNETNKLINQCKNDNIEHIYLYSYNMLGGGNKALMQAFIAKATCNDIHVWAMDGYRGYFADWGGSTTYINFINAVITYNSTVASNERFYGIHGDNEPQDGQGEPRSSFHNGIKDSDLSTAPGSGEWQSTEKLDREYLMRDWLSTTQQAYTLTHNNCMLYGQAMPSWLDDYFGEAVYCTYNSTYKRVLEHIMPYLDHYCIMSYNTSPANVINRCTGEITYANSLPAASRPLVWAGLETHCGIGSGISYCDTPGKNSKGALWTDVATIESSLSTHISYAGINIHDWVDGWRDLSPVSSNTADPGCSNPGAVVGCPLPVHLLNLTGVFDGDKIILNWTTVTENNNSHFEIQKSDDGIDFSAVDIVTGMGNTTSVSNYEWHDFEITAPQHYYKLIQTDFDGSTQESEIVRVDTGDEYILTILPSTSDGTTSIQIHSTKPDYVKLEVFDLNGRNLFTKDLDIVAGTNTLNYPGIHYHHGSVSIFKVTSIEYNEVVMQKIILHY